MFVPIWAMRHFCSLWTIQRKIRLYRRAGLRRRPRSVRTVLTDSRAKARTFYALSFAFYFEFESCDVIENVRQRTTENERQGSNAKQKEDVEGSPAACPLHAWVKWRCTGGP
ncbi:hypothetical protein AN477_21950 [Alicyclobacillus ferrooxydans]|uniref:Uncharacterized protein n=1 Tax=Alicyclobacillus ferrooxydans TaxID=471514 RepID=A0A0P9GK95_9BACL|nr:hypothetical protein AN477_21950 [Alicyclobacillus ferrooxydans]